LIAPDFDERKLLLAELREAGYEVLPAPDADYAIRAMLLKLILPSLVLWDEQGGRATTPAERDHVSRLAPDVPWLVIENAIPTCRQQPLRQPLARVLRRPLRIGQVVEAMRSLIP
jgi:hypothetical protein